MFAAFFKKLFSHLSSSFFWEDGRVMIIISIAISIGFLIILYRITNLKWKVWLPVILCGPIIIFGAIMMFFPNGTGGVTQHFYLGITMYSSCILLFTGVGEIIMILLKKLVLKHKK